MPVREGDGRGAEQEQRPVEARPHLERVVHHGLREGGRDALHGITVMDDEPGDVLVRGAGSIGAAGGGRGSAIEEEVDDAEAALVGAELPQQPWQRGWRGWRVKICLVCSLP